MQTVLKPVFFIKKLLYHLSFGFANKPSSSSSNKAADCWGFFIKKCEIHFIYREKLLNNENISLESSVSLEKLVIYK